MKNSLILLMAGTGSRMKMDTNKVLLPLGNKKIYEYSLDLFKKYNFEIICVVNENDKLELPDYVKVATGGKSRMESVYNGLRLVTGNYVFIHDSARPFLAKEVLEELIANISDDYAMLCADKVKDTIRILEDNKLKVLNRDNLVAAKTPQCAPTKILLDSYHKAMKENKLFTDDIAVIENYHPEFEIKIINSNPDNFKITTKIDYELAKLIWRNYD